MNNLMLYTCNNQDLTRRGLLIDFDYAVDHTIQSNIPKVVHDYKFDKLPMFSASGYSADCTEL
jgi:phosphosulfolactate phosphohydrolase-like enzyme